MSEFTTPSPPSPHNKQTPQHHLSTAALLLFSDIQLLFSYLISHPLYLSYLLFFSPSLLKLLSYLSPLFLTTSLLLLSILLTLSHPCRLTYQSLVATLTTSSLAPDHHHDFDYSAKEALQVYNIVFDVGDDQLVPQKHQRDGGATEEEEEEAVKKDKGTTAAEVGSVMTLATLLQQHQKQEEEFGDILLLHHHDKEAKEVKARKVVEVGRREEPGSLTGSDDAKATIAAITVTGEGKEEAGKDLGSYGSMRKEKEWRRTLACKLFEERHNADSSEGMDLLWETYETDQSGKCNGKAAKAGKKSSKYPKPGKKKGASNKIGHHYYDDDDDDYIAGEEEGDKEINGDDGGRLCCLQALKFSAGKMNLGGMGKPNLVKISKAIKGFGWLHGVTSRHPKTKRVPLN